MVAALQLLAGHIQLTAKNQPVSRLGKKTHKSAFTGGRGRGGKTGWFLEVTGKKCRWMNYEIGCDQLQNWYLAYKSGFKRVRAILKAVEAVKVKLWCFKGIVNPTHFQKHVGWGTWLAFPPLPCHSPPKSVGQKAIAPPGGDQERTAGESFTEKTSHCMDGIFNHLHPVHGTHFKH